MASRIKVGAYCRVNCSVAIANFQEFVEAHLTGTRMGSNSCKLQRCKGLVKFLFSPELLEQGGWALGILNLQFKII